MKNCLRFLLRSLLMAVLSLWLSSLHATPLPVFEVAAEFSSPAVVVQPGVAMSTDGNLNIFGSTQAGGANKKGSLYKVTESGSLSTIISFAGTNGLAPVSGLMLHTDGNLYGALTGTSPGGALFSLTQTGTYSKLVVLTGTGGFNPGDQPTGGMVTGTDGNLYGVTAAGGDSNRGTIYRLSFGGGTPSYSVIKNFAGSDGATPMFAPVQVSDGNLYGTTFSGGTDNLGVIYKIGLDGTYNKLLDFPANNGLRPYGGLIQARDGNLYGTACDVNYTRGLVFRLTTSGSLSTLFEFTPNLNMVPTGGVVQGPDGNFYGTTFNGGRIGFGTVYQVTPEGVLSVVYSFSGNNASDGSAPLGPLTLAADGNIYGVTNGALFRVRFGPKPISANALPVSYSSATLYGRVNPKGQKTTVYFQYAAGDPKLANPNLVKASPSESGTVGFTASADATLLASGTTYYYRMMAVNVTGTQFGLTNHFTTKPFAEPTTAVEILGDRATFKSTINPRGQHVEVNFRYGVDPKLSGAPVSVLVTGSETALSSTIHVGPGFKDRVVEKTVGKLLPLTTYYYRVETTDPVYGTQVGTIHSLTTVGMGNYNGPITNDAPTGIYSGYLSVKITSSQSMSGALFFGGVRYSLKGAFTNGKFTRTIFRKGLPDIRISLSVDPVNDQLTGTVTMGVVSSNITAGQQLYSKVNQTTQAGSYTMVLTPNAPYKGAGFPAGTGFLAASINGVGAVKISGRLGDGSPVVSSGYLTNGDAVPFYAGLYGSKSSSYGGSVSGNINFHVQNVQYGWPACDATFFWYKAPQPKAVFYPEGFSLLGTGTGSNLVNFGKGFNPVTGSMYQVFGRIDFSGGNLSGFSKAITFNPNNSVTVDLPDVDRLKMSVSKNGVINGSFFDPGTQKFRDFHGIYLQIPTSTDPDTGQSYSAGGYFLGSDQAGSFSIFTVQ